MRERGGGQRGGEGQEEVSAVVGGEGVWLVVVVVGVGGEIQARNLDRFASHKCVGQGVDEAARAHFLCSLAAAQF